MRSLTRPIGCPEVPVIPHANRPSKPMTETHAAAVCALAMLIGPACGGSGDDILSRSDCADGEVDGGSYGPEGEERSLCLGTEATVAYPEYVDGLPDHFAEAPLARCAGHINNFPIAATGSTSTVTLKGQVTKFGKAPQPVGTCVVALLQEPFEAHLRSLPATDDPDRLPPRGTRETCFVDHDGDVATPKIYDAVGSTEICRKNVDLEFGAATAAEIVVGVACSDPPGIAEDYGQEDNLEIGKYEIADVPTGVSLVVRVSGPPNEWVDTYKYGLFIPDEQEAMGTVVSEVSVISLASWRTVPVTAHLPRGVQKGNGAIAGSISDCGAPPAADAPGCDLSRTCAPGAACDCESGLVCVPADGAGVCQRLPWSVVGAKVGTTSDSGNIAYFSGIEGDNLPSPGRLSSNILGVYAAIDVQGGDVTVSAVADVNGTATVLGEATIFLVPRSVAIMSFRGEWTGHFPWYL